MRIKIPIAVAICLTGVAALFPVLSSQVNNADGVAAVTKLENDGVKASLANDVSYMKTNLADDFVGGTSFGEWQTKAAELADAADPANNKTNTMTISDLKVIAHGNVAIARYTDTYDDMHHGEHRNRAVICTDTWVNEGGAWKEAASHCSKSK